MITVAIPVGPYEANKRWLKEALLSVANQTMQPTEILVIDDMARFGHTEICGSCPDCNKSDWRVENLIPKERGFLIKSQGRPDIRSWSSPWRLGVAHAFNFGVALAENELVFLMGSDDLLEPNCLEECYKAWEKNHKADAYYFCGIRYMDDGETQTVPCGYALITKGFWHRTGGFPIESAVGAPDAAFISILLVHNSMSLVPVAGGTPLVNYRRHSESDTAGKSDWQGVIMETRDIVTRNWIRPEW